MTTWSVEEPTGFAELMTLQPHGPDTFVATSLRYPWGRVYGGQVIAQALAAAAVTVDPRFRAHSLHAYFLRGGDITQPIRYEVDRSRDGRSFWSRRVAARQSGGAIATCEVSFHQPQGDADLQTRPAPAVPGPDDVGPGYATHMLRHRPLDRRPGHQLGWLRLEEELDDDPVTQACALAYISDHLATGTVRSQHPEDAADADDGDARFSQASLDHALYLHRPCRADEWLLFDLSSAGLTDSRGLAVGYVYTQTGVHVATFTQEVLLRGPRVPPPPG